MRNVRHIQSMKNIQIMQIQIMQICKTAPFTPSLRKQSKVFVWYYLFLFLIYSLGETSEVYGDMVKVSKNKRST